MATLRPYQVVVWGASGFTGKLVCEHLASDYTGRVRWAMAGRSREKLEGVRRELAAKHPAVKDVPILVADPFDRVAVGGVLVQADVVVCTTGPFSQYANTVVEQSVEQGTHYCDITGEVPWVKTNIDKHHTKAAGKGVKIVHCCGFDSVPSDMGALMMAHHCRTKLNRGVSKVVNLVQPGETKGGASGGTIATMLGFSKAFTMAELGRMSGDAYYLAAATPGGKRGSDVPSPNKPSYIAPLKTWAGPFIMESCNGRIVHLSNAIAGAGLASPAGPGAYGTDFKYQEGLEEGDGYTGWAWAAALSLAVAIGGISLFVPPMRWLLTRVLPAPGSGPSLEQQRTSGCWKMDFVAITEGDGAIVRGTASDKRDPGYWSTSRMVLEAALCLALDGPLVESQGGAKGGVLTPATAMGMHLITRLRDAGQTWRVDA